MRYFLILFLLLCAFWLLLSGYWDNDLLLAFGAASSLLVAWIGSRLIGADPPRSYPVSIVRITAYSWWLLVEIVKANIDVVKRIWLPKEHPISPCMARLPLSQVSGVAKAAYAQSITLTPGTVAIEVTDDDVEVHALTKEGLDALREGEMDRRVTSVEKGHR
ncbi:MAG: Na+/H+ antiporter subunit E [Thiohalocapsa sp.]|nr:Na+/H+ antiporter subunit E [Thiohalocapsa sp.]MCF7990961.1 Na+/H+ antiporter subunit E [Thiohalocapsa sp.]